jgi:hypothetical protein
MTHPFTCSTEISLQSGCEAWPPGASISSLASNRFRPSTNAIPPRFCKRAYSVAVPRQNSILPETIFPKNNGTNLSRESRQQLAWGDYEQPGETRNGGPLGTPAQIPSISRPVPMTRLLACSVPSRRGKALNSPRRAAIGRPPSRSTRSDGGFSRKKDGVWPDLTEALPSSPATDNAGRTG